MSLLAERSPFIGRSPRIDVAELRRSAFADAPVVLLAISYIMGVLVVNGEGPIDFASRLPVPFLTIAAMTIVTAIAFGTFRCLATTRPASPMRQLMEDARGALRTGWLERWLPTALACTGLVAAFDFAKSRIPQVAGGFHWDATFDKLDRALHGGYAPWELLQPVLGYPIVTALLDINYGLWFPLMWGVFFYQKSLRAGTPGRTRFLVSFVLIWALGGTLLATAFSSVGPCYFGHVVEGADPYQPLMTYLQTVDAQFPVMALRIQALLWTQHAAGVEGFGISAMPSLHNAIALLLFLSAGRLHPGIRLAFLIHAVLIFFGSILLGWHYAVDAYLSFAMTAAVWFGVGPLANRWDRWVVERASRRCRPEAHLAAVSSARP